MLIVIYALLFQVSLLCIVHLSLQLVVELLGLVAAGLTKTYNNKHGL